MKHFIAALLVCFSASTFAQIFPPYVTTGTFVPYTGATTNIDIGANNFSTTGLVTVGNSALFGYPAPFNLKSYTDTGSSAPANIVYGNLFVTQSKGNNTTFIGAATGLFEARDRSDVTVSNKGVLYALQLSVVPSQARNNSPYDDVTGLAISNTTGTSGAKGTDAIYLAHNSSVFPSTSEWFSGLTIASNNDIAIQIAGRQASYGIDLQPATFPSGAAIRLPNASNIYFRNAANSGDVPVIGMDNTNTINLGGTNVAGTHIANYFGTTAPTLVNAAACTSGYTVTTNDNWLLVTTTCALTLPPVSQAGRILHVKTTVGAVTSAASNVVPLIGGSAGNAILPATAGKWCTLVSDSANWQIMEGN